MKSVKPHLPEGGARLEYSYKGHTIKIETKQVTPPPASAPRIIQVALWISNERIMPVVFSPLEAKSFSSVDDATAHAKKAAEQIIENKVKDFAPTVGMSPAALEEVLDCIESKMSYRHAADLLRSEYNTPLSTELWAKIRKWAGQKSE